MATKDDIENVDEVDDVLLIDKIPKTTELTDSYWRIIDTNLKKNMNRFKMFIAKYRNRYIELLETPYPVDYPPWREENKSIIYDVCGIDGDEFTEDCIKYIRGPEDYKDPYMKDKGYAILLNMIIRWCMINNKKQDLEVVEHYVGYSYYWMVHHKYFPKFKPDPAAMRYTVMHMTFKTALRAAGSVDKWLFTGVQGSYDTYKDRLLDGYDYMYYYIGEKIRGKFDGYMKNIYRDLEETIEAGNMVFISEDEVDEVRVEGDSTLAQVISLAEKFTSRMLLNIVDERLIENAKKRIKGNVSTRDIRATLEVIVSRPTGSNELERLIQALLYLFLTDNKAKNKPRDIGGAKFLREMDRLYKTGNSEDKNRITIKDTLDTWLTVGSKTFRTTKRVSTESNFRKCLYDYFILLMIQLKH